jgi:hypothetical protein
MNKKEVQKRVLKNGKPIPLNKFSWYEKTKTFISKECYLVIDFAGISGCTFTVNGYKFPIPPIRFNGSRYYIETSGTNLVRSGCIEKTLNWWVDNVRRCAEENNYTPDQIDEYELYVHLIKLWFDKYGAQIRKVEE